MAISNQTTDKVRERVDIEEVVNDYVTLKRKGQNLWACCPFHEEKSPSFSVSPAKQIYKCFGCGKAGDPIQFIMDIEGVGFPEAIKHLATKYGIEIEEDKNIDPADIQAYNEKESLYIALNFAKDFFHENLQSGEGKSIGLSYLKERGFDSATIEKFELGYSLDGWDHLLNKAKTSGFEETNLLKAGLILERENKPGNYYDRFRGRVMFPIHNLSGKAIAFGARIMTQDKKQPKYINSPETAIYHKSDVLYGIYQAKQAIRQKENCYLVEGYTDVISMHLAGVENVVASSGTSLTENQIKLIKRFSDQVTVLYDGDDAGINASLRGIDMLLEGGLNVKAVVFPPNEDPDSFSRKAGKEGFQKFLEAEEKDFIHFKIDLFTKGAADDPIKKAEAIRQVVLSISKVPDPIIRSVYAKESARLLGMEEDILLTELNRQLLKNQQKKSPSKFQKAPESSPIEQLLPGSPEEETKKTGPRTIKEERELVRILINYGFEMVSEEMHVCEYLLEEIKDLNFGTPIYQELLNHYKNALREGTIPKFDYFLKIQNPKLKTEVIDMVAPTREISQNWESKHQIFSRREADDLPETTYKASLKLKSAYLKRMRDELEEKIKLAKEEELEELLTMHMELTQLKSKIDRELGNVIPSRN
ncbi:DNA primase [Cyclobacterium sp. 1_MG-2023]|uniref:DNA primase n=1 Tax=Cyclobacterium sp. 1_MG-2023 TaxID=3062681 RepID=UPI0026E31086|nr:DNA primase [Cyclobacterium sp. 1_MG-2023]MDO6437351.1 DNA primase [Cyclobacterium sp. 1_MG-2023]